MRSQEIKIQLDEAESLLLEIKERIAKSDEHALKCYKLGISFSETYPEDFEEYEHARAEYNSQETVCATLQAQYDEAVREESEEDAPIPGEGEADGE